jgi:hypothetical protein
MSGIVVTSTPNTITVQTQVAEAKAAETASADVKAKETPAPAVEPAEKLADASETLEASEAQDETDAEAEADGKDEEGQEKPKKKGGYQRRVDKLTRQKSELEREVDFWRQKALADQPAAKAEVKAAPDESKKPKAEDFKTHEDWFEAMADWKIDQRDKQREVKAAEEKAKSVFDSTVKTYAEREAEFQNDHDDYDEAKESVAHIPVSIAVNQCIFESEVGPAITYELAKNPKELKRICALPAMAAAREIGKIEARIQKTAEATPKEEIKPSKAPKPIAPVKAAAAAPAKTIFEAQTQGDYERIRREQMAKRNSAWG